MYYLGVDIGGTKTAMIITDETGTVLSFRKGEGSNYQLCGIAASFQVLETTLEGACEEAGIKKQDIDEAFFGVAGADLDYDYEIISEILKRLELKSYHFDNDGLIALRAGVKDGKGILVTCGTGSISFGNNGREIMRKGGFSNFFGERLGGYHVAGMVASAIVRGADGRGSATIMHDLLEKNYSVTIEEMMKTEYPDVPYTGPDVNIALISTLYEAAKLSDMVALTILSEIAGEVVAIVNAFRKDMVFTPLIKVVLEGSVFKHADKLLIDMIRNGLGNDCRVVIPDHDPVTGAVLFALEKNGEIITEEIHENLLKTYNEKVRR